MYPASTTISTLLFLFYLPPYFAGEFYSKSQVLYHSACKHLKTYLNFFFFVFWLCWVFFAACRLSLAVVGAGLVCSCGVWASHCRGFSCCGTWALGHVGFRSCGAWAQWSHSMWIFLDQGLSLFPSVLAGRFLTTAVPGES